MKLVLPCRSLSRSPQWLRYTYWHTVHRLWAPTCKPHCVLNWKPSWMSESILMVLIRPHFGLIFSTLKNLSFIPLLLMNSTMAKKAVRLLNKNIEMERSPQEHTNHLMRVVPTMSNRNVLREQREQFAMISISSTRARAKTISKSNSKSKTKPISIIISWSHKIELSSI